MEIGWHQQRVNGGMLFTLLQDERCTVFQPDHQLMHPMWAMVLPELLEMRAKSWLEGYAAGKLDNNKGA